MDSSDRPKPPHLRRSHTGLPKLAAIGRTDSGQQSSKEPRRAHLPTLHNHHRSNHRHDHHYNPKEVVQSAIQLHHPSSFADLLKPNTRSATHSPAPSSAGAKPDSEKSKDEAQDAKQPPPRLVRPEEVERERWRAKARDEELQKSLQSLNAYALDTMRRLDVTLYSILEKVSDLRSSIGALEELSTLTKALHENFQNESQGLEHEINGQIEGFRGFEAQQHLVEELESRLNNSKENTQSLNERLEAARRRVEAREQIEIEWQARVSRRLRILWSVVGSILLLIVIGVLIQYLRLPHRDRPRLRALHHHSIDLDAVSIPPPVKEILSSVHASATSTSTSPSVFTPAISTDNDDRTLRLFDEL